MKIKILNNISDRATLIMNPFEEDSDCYVIKFFWINYELGYPILRYISYINSDEHNTITMQ